LSFTKNPVFFNTHNNERLKIINVSQSSNLQDSIDNSKNYVSSPFKSIRLKHRIEANRNNMEPRISCDNINLLSGQNKHLSQEIDELIKRQKESLKEDFYMAKKCEVTTPMKNTHNRYGQLPSHHQVRAAAVASGDLDGAEDDENCLWGEEEDSFTNENIEEAPVSIVNPSNIKARLENAAAT